MSDSWRLQNRCSALKSATDYIIQECIQQRVYSQDTNRERGRDGCVSNRPSSGETYSGACTRPCSTPLSRNCCGCRHSPRIWSAHTSSDSCRSASGAWRHGRGQFQPPGCTPLPGGQLVRSSGHFQSQLQTLRKKKKTTNKHSLLLLHLHILLHKTINILKRLLFVHCEQDLAAVWLQEKRRMICHHCSLRKLNSTSQCLLWAEEKAICWCIHLSNYSLAEI